MEGEGEKGKRRVKLFCPSVCKIAQIITWDEDKLDLGSIARVFGLDPNTLKLNGHFISRGVDLVASSVTWKSLIGFFSARGLSTGASDSDALLVDGKLYKIGSKRSHDLEDAGNGIINANEQDYCRDTKKPQRGHCSLSVGVDVTKEHNGLSSKRKLWLEDETRLKKTKSDRTASGNSGKNGYYFNKQPIFL